jgi:hypothetical protein
MTFLETLRQAIYAFQIGMAPDLQHNIRRVRVVTDLVALAASHRLAYETNKPLAWFGGRQRAAEPWPN